jgi:mRNA interferase RelE/StbE
MSSGRKFEIRIKKSAEREMDALPAQIFSRITKEILQLESSPRPRGCKKLRGRHEYRLRVGDYRILYTVNDDSSSIEIITVGHRRDVYR